MTFAAPAGLDAEDVAEAFRILHSSADLGRAIDRLPVLRAPLFHSQLRRHVTERAPGAAFRARYNELFRRLHERALRNAVHGPGESARPDAATGFRQPPAFFAALTGARRTRLPTPRTAPLDPAVHAPALRSELRKVGIDPTTIPTYQPREGERWSVLAVDCPACDGRRLVAHAHYVDLLAVPGHAGAVRSGHYNAHACPTCASSVAMPAFVWIGDGPCASDPVNALGWTLRVDERFLLHCPARGLERSAELDRVLEIRFDKLLKELAVVATKDGSERVWKIGFAYSGQELARILEHHAEAEPWPPEMAAVIADCATKLQRREATVTSIRAWLEGFDPAVLRNWPATLVEGLLPSHPHRALAANLIGEACAAAQEKPFERALHGVGVAHALVVLQDVTLAEAELVRVADLAHGRLDASEDQVLTRQMRPVWLEVHANSENYNGVTALLEECLEDAADQTCAGRLMTAQTLGLAALLVFRRGALDVGFPSFLQVIGTLRGLIEEVSAEPELLRSMLPRVQQALGAALANWSSLLFEVADFLDLREFTDPASGARRLDDETIERILTRPGHERLGWGQVIAGARDRSAESIPLPLPLPGLPLLQIMVVTVELIRKAAAAASVSARELRTFSLDVLREALELTESAGHWTHAARQLGHLAAETVRVHPGADVTDLLARALECASRASDDATVAELQVGFAERALRQGETATAGEHAREAGRAAVRALLRRGEHAEASHQQILDQIADLALRCALAGERAGPCIALAESLRAVSLSVSMTRDMSFLSAPAVVATRERAAELRKQRDALLSADASGPSVVRAEALLALERTIEETRREGVLRDSRYIRWGDSTQADVADARELRRAMSELGPHATYLGCFRAQRTIWTYAVWDGGELVEQSPSPDWQGHVCRTDPFDPERPSLDRTKLAYWSTALLSPLAARLASLPKDAPVVISAGPGLDWLPFAALSLDGQPLCERVHIHRVQGVGVLEACRRRAPAKMASLLAVGDPVRPHWPALPATRAEIEGIARMFQGHGRDARTLLGTQATLSALAEFAPSADILHFACHAARPFQGAPESALLLTRDSGRDDGLLDASAVVRRLHLKPGCFVNLAACDSAAQGEGFGPAAVGLVPAFLMKGARAVLASLWPLADESAARFSDAFYSELLRGRSHAAALADVQRQCIAGAFGPDTCHAERWGAYMLYGLG